MKTIIPPVEWPTLSLLGLVYGLWFWATGSLYETSQVLSILMTGLLITQFSSLQHEGLHGHPFASARLNEAILTPALTLTVPYGRFRDTHLAHHYDPIVTDPYDDPESNYADPEAWSRLPRAIQHLFRANNTLLGRIVLGPLIGNALWLRTEARALWIGNKSVRRDWGFHLLGLVPVVGWIWVAAMPWWAYLLAAWIGHGLLKIRTFLEHRAHENPRARTVIIPDRGPLALLFLNNNYHSVHHCHPGVAWYQLPSLYAANRDLFMRRNEGYAYRSYVQVFAQYFLRAKDPVPHPFYPKSGSNSDHDALLADQIAPAQMADLAPVLPLGPARRT